MRNNNIETAAVAGIVTALVYWYKRAKAAEMNSNIEIVEIDVEVLAVTDDALLLNDGLTETWFPKSQIFDDRVHTLEREEQAPKLRVAYWLAKKKGLI